MRHLVVFEDSYSKLRYGILTREKSDVKRGLEQVLALVKTLGLQVKELLSDNGGEFDNKEVKAILQNERIIRRLTTPYTPEQNSMSEREMRTIVEMTRTFMYSNQEVDFPTGP